MHTAEATIRNRLGLHARAAAKFVKLATGFRSGITLERGGQQANGKSIMGILMLAAAEGATVKISAGGEDEEEAVKALVDLVNGKFGEHD
ncbi:MAG: HPr family phosphocarrier protein [Candidatus Tectomicrobia bacterium]|uniref:HPr family phosphocarrier protein n=1 Tax=Tectimicrobiota bacterium TaxID=2528274 RepID=A0A932GRN5_UNCTE|nr:HPr family phosphocarrier protein [Candidatus Tectomicrobia bacterium]